MNRFLQVPAEFDMGAPLISVDLSLNFIAEISYRISFLSSVTHLDLSKNNIARLHPGTTTVSFDQQPSCSNTTSSVWRSLLALQVFLCRPPPSTLDLSPPPFSLDLSFNARLRSLPLTACNLTRLSTLQYKQVPLAFPPPAVINDGTHRVASL